MRAEVLLQMQIVEVDLVDVRSTLQSDSHGNGGNVDGAIAAGKEPPRQFQAQDRKEEKNHEGMIHIGHIVLDFRYPNPKKCHLSEARRFSETRVSTSTRTEPAGIRRIR